MFTSEAINLNSESSGISTAPNSLCLTDNDNSFSFNANLPGNKKDVQQQQQQKQLASMHLLNDERILHNLLFMEDNYCIQSNYFLVVQNEIKPWMRTVLANWMLEVSNCRQQQQRQQQNVDSESILNCLDLFGNFKGLRESEMRGRCLWLGHEHTRQISECATSQSASFATTWQRVHVHCIEIAFG
jgi:hypothetical protein